jgi:hypothetical protein
MKIISWIEASKAGLKYYFTGKPCRAGHRSRRFLSTQRCTLCVAEKSRNPERTKARRAGESTYLSDRTCRLGHTPVRIVANNVCLRCSRLPHKENR